MARLFDFSYDEPLEPTVGKGWIDFAGGNIFLRLNNNWIPIAGGIPSLLRETTLFIRGLDKTPYMKRGSLRVRDNLTAKVDMCNFIYEDYDNSYKPREGDEIIIFNGTTKIFGGQIIRAPQKQLAIGRYSYSIQAYDYSALLRKLRVVETYTNEKAGDIIKDLINKYAKEITYVNVQDGITIDYISFNYKTVEESVREIAKLTGYDWYVDYDLDLHFFAFDTYNAPYTLTDDAITGRYRGLKININKTQLRNRTYVRGGFYLSDLYEQFIEADGDQLDFALTYTPYAPISVFVNDAAKTLGIENIDTSGKDFLVNVAEKVIKNLDQAKLNAGDVFKATYKYKVPILVSVDDEDSQAAVRAFEGGDGIFEGPIIVDESIETLDGARERATADIRDYSNPLVTGTFITDQSGYRSGQKLIVNIPSRNFDAQYLIRSVTRKSLGMGKFIYSIQFASRLKGLTEFLIELLQTGKKIITRNDEVIDELASVSDEIIISAIAPTFEEFTPPFQYGPGGTQQGKYNECTYKT